MICPYCKSPQPTHLSQEPTTHASCWACHHLYAFRGGAPKQLDVVDQGRLREALPRALYATADCGHLVAVMPDAVRAEAARQATHGSGPCWN